MPDPLTFIGQLDNALTYMVAGWAAYIMIFVVGWFNDIS